MKTLKSTWPFLFFCMAALTLTTNCAEPSEKEDNSTIVQAELSPDSAADPPEKTDVETVIENTKAIINAGQELIDARRRRDSIRIASREKMFAYQLGLPFRTKQLVVEAYKRLSDTDGIRVLKKSKREFLLIKFDDKDEEQLLAELDDYINEHGDEIIGTVKIIDLVRECGKHKKPIQDANIEEKRGDVSIDCLTCNNE